MNQSIPLPDTSKSQRGQSLVEMAVIMVVLLILLGGVVDLGRAFFTYMALRDAVQEGALYGSINPTDTIAIKNHVLNSSETIASIIQADDITVTIVGSACTGNGIDVNATYPDFPLGMPFMGTILGSQTIAITASITDTILSPACQ